MPLGPHVPDSPDAALAELIITLQTALRTIRMITIMACDYPDDAARIQAIREITDAALPSGNV